MRRYPALVLLLMLIAVPCRAQWAYVGPPENTHYVDLAARDGMLLLSVNPGSPPRSLQLSTNGGATWEQVRDRGSISIAATDTGFIAQAPGLFLGDATARVWTEVSSPATNILRFFYDRGTKRLYAATRRSGFQMSTDQGATWTNMGVASEDLTFVHARGNRIVTGYHNAGGRGFYSLDDGTTWRNPVGGSDNYVGGFVGTDGRLYMLTSGWFMPASVNLWRSTDDGTTWTNLTKDVQGIPGIPLQMQGQVYAEGPRILFTAGTDVWTSSDDGATWGKQRDGITPASNVTGSATQMVIDGGYMYLLFQAFVPPQTGFGVYRRPLAELGFTGQAASVRNNDASGALSLDVTPNPTVGPAAITLQLDRSSTVRVTVHDMLGHPVATLHDGTLDAGRHDVAWRGEMPSGLYVVRAEISGRTISRALMHTR